MTESRRVKVYICIVACKMHFWSTFSMQLSVSIHKTHIAVLFFGSIVVTFALQASSFLYWDVALQKNADAAKRRRDFENRTLNTLVNIPKMGRIFSKLSAKNNQRIETKYRRKVPRNWARVIRKVEISNFLNQFQS